MSLERTSLHWGTYDIGTINGEVVSVDSAPDDPDPSPIGANLLGNLKSKVRIYQPAVRESFLKSRLKSGHRRGREAFVSVSWDYAEKLVAEELDRVRSVYGNESIYGGSYGWGSAGRFHHAQSQLHRFLNLIGGFTRSVNTYSFAAAEVLLPYIVGSQRPFISRPSNWQNLIGNTELFVAFGGIPLKNSQVSSGGLSAHLHRDYMKAAYRAGIKFVNVSPIRSDTKSELKAEWVSLVPNTDVALMLGLAFTIVSENLHDSSFLENYCVGFEKIEGYLFGKSDGIKKTALWASEICGVKPDVITSLARRMIARRTLISASWSMTRQDHGEQIYWMTITLAALVGQIGLPGGGFAFGYSAENKVGVSGLENPVSRLAQGINPVTSFIPVARIADMLLGPGQTFSYNGADYVYPDIRFVYWAGGNPFHHHQDLARLMRAWHRPETIICNDIHWTATARCSDIVLPVASPLERNDIGGSPSELSLLAMKQICPAAGEARTDHDILSGIARQLGVDDQFTEGLDEMDWIKRLYLETVEMAEHESQRFPSFEEFWDEGEFKYSKVKDNYVMLREFRVSPSRDRLSTPSGKIELYSEVITEFQYKDCPGYPTWLEPHEWLGSEQSRDFPLHLITNQPGDRLHSQLDFGPASSAGKVSGREKITINPDDAKSRSIKEGDIVRVFNDRGEVLAGAHICSGIRSSVVQMATGAWWDPFSNKTASCKHGNVNVLTKDQGTSQLAQGPTALSCLVQVEPYLDEVPDLTAHIPPEIRSF
ncbi:MAG: Asp-tRNA(Asn)/Glu-tRNA(Gln) amidotransferase GatCAB subunit C [Gammaproteobacteria bacterium]|nr:Asp-tRNA(Asn)/Glu-tRNA(Gln) amidotransferase GatCAB subunit C [Gammaproteobacteria bacterium]